MINFTPRTRKHFIRWLGINALIGVSIPLFFNPQAYTSLEGLSQVWDDMFFSFFMSAAISSAVGVNEIILDKYFPWLEHAGKRFFMEILGVTIFGFTASFLVNVIVRSMFGWVDFNDFPWRSMFMNSLYPTAIGYVITAFFISRGFLARAKAEAVRAEQLQTEKYRSEVRVLKDQLNPHFLFNSLNVLTNLVYEDADKSADYIRNLSRFYRYVLEVQDEDLVELDRELKFTRDYLQLQQERFGSDALIYSVEVKEADSYEIPPLALQLLVENALKHNRASKTEPLHLVIRQEGSRLIVENSLQKRSVESEHLGIGLSNLIRRYELLGADPVQIKENETEFKVSIPLIAA